MSERWRQTSPYFPDNQWTDARERLSFYALGLIGEVGELANVVKKEWRGDVGDWLPAMVEELAGARIYLERIADTSRPLPARDDPRRGAREEAHATRDAVFQAAFVASNFAMRVLADAGAPRPSVLRRDIFMVYGALEHVADTLGVGLDDICAAEFERAEAKAIARMDAAAASILPLGSAGPRP